MIDLLKGITDSTAEKTQAGLIVHVILTSAEGSHRCTSLTDLRRYMEFRVAVKYPIIFPIVMHKRYEHMGRDDSFVLQKMIKPKATKAELVGTSKTKDEDRKIKTKIVKFFRFEDFNSLQFSL